MTLYLASQSPRRREILNQLGVNFTQISQEIDERVFENESPEDYVTRLAISKAKAGYSAIEESSLDDSATQSTENICVLGADTIVVLDGHILGKPKDQQSSYDMLMSLSTRQHTVMSAVAIVSPNAVESGLSKTDVFFRSINPLLIQEYWQTGEPCDKAGSYGIQGFGAVFVEKIIGSYSGVVGLPIEILIPLFEKLNIGYWNEKLK